MALKSKAAILLLIHSGPTWAPLEEFCGQRLVKNPAFVALIGKKNKERERESKIVSHFEETKP